MGYRLTRYLLIDHRRATGYNYLTFGNSFALLADKLRGEHGCRTTHAAGQKRTNVNYYEGRWWEKNTERKVTTILSRNTVALGTLNKNRITRKRTRVGVIYCMRCYFSKISPTHQRIYQVYNSYEINTHVFRRKVEIIHSSLYAFNNYVRTRGRLHNYILRNIHPIYFVIIIII